MRLKIYMKPSVSCAGFILFQAEDGIRDADVTGVQTCALPICAARVAPSWGTPRHACRAVSTERACSQASVGSSGSAQEVEFALAEARGYGRRRKRFAGVPRRLHTARALTRSSGARGKAVKTSRLVPVLVLSLYIAGSTNTDVSAATAWQFPAGLTNVVASSPTSGGGYTDPPGQMAPDPGTWPTCPINA